MWIGSVCVCVQSEKSNEKKCEEREKRNPIHQEQRTTTNFQVGWEKQWQERNLISTLTVSDDAVRFRLLLLLLLLLLLSLLESLQASDVNNGADFFDTAAPTTIIIRNVILFNFSRCRSMTVLAISIVFHADNEKVTLPPNGRGKPTVLQHSTHRTIFLSTAAKWVTRHFLLFVHTVLDKRVK